MASLARSRSRLIWKSCCFGFSGHECGLIHTDPAFGWVISFSLGGERDYGPVLFSATPTSMTPTASSSLTTPPPVPLPCGMTPGSVNALLDLLHGDLERSDAALEKLRPRLATELALLDDAQLDEADEVAAEVGGWLLALHDHFVVPAIANSLFDENVFDRWCEFLSALCELGTLHAEWKAVGVRADAVQRLVTEHRELRVLGLVGEVADAEIDKRQSHR